MASTRFDTGTCESLRALAHPLWALGFGDEVWWSRLAQPNQHCWREAGAKSKWQELNPAQGRP